MSSVTEFICLVNSRKHGGRCIAGIEPRSGKWIRPVSDLDDGRVARPTRLIDGREPRLGERLAVPLASGVAKRCQERMALLCSKSCGGRVYGEREALPEGGICSGE
ncbi:MAG: dual OB domain-containing protein [Planctomycetota bacterium]